MDHRKSIRNDKHVRVKKRQQKGRKGRKYAWASISQILFIHSFDTWNKTEKSVHTLPLEPREADK